MPYIPNYDPPPNWFAGRTYLLQAKEFIDSVKSNNSNFRYTGYLLALTNIFRGIRSALEMPPSTEQKDAASKIQDLKDRINPEHYTILSNYYFGQSYRYLFYLWNYEEHVIKATANATPSDKDCSNQERIEAINERIQALDSCMQVAIDVFRDIYLRDTEHDRHYYGFWDSGETDAAINLLIENGYSPNQTDAQKRIDEEDEKAFVIIEKSYQEYNDKLAADEHDERFWNWDEEGLIRFKIDTMYFHY